MTYPRVSFGIIVLNGEPYTRYCLRALYPFAHQIIVVEGACEGGRSVATADGHSADGTLDVLRRFKRDEDPEGKITIVTAEDHGYPDGFWPGEKDEQSQAYAQRVTGDYLWQIDIDEFYMPEDMQVVLDLLQRDPSITAVSFKQIQFWGGFSSFVDGFYLRSGAEVFHRVFRWEPGSTYTTHRPPTVHTPERRDTRTIKWLKGKDMTHRGIFLYHYSFVFPKQVHEKSAYYGAAAWARRPGSVCWAKEAYDRLGRPFQVHNVYKFTSWLEPYTGAHPPQIEAMRSDIARGQLRIDVRDTSDIEQLLSAPWYRAAKFFFKLCVPTYNAMHALRRLLRHLALWCRCIRQKKLYE